MTTEALKKKRIRHDPIEMYAFSLPPYNMSVKEIASKFGVHEVTASNKLSEAKKILEPIYAAQRAELDKPRENNKVALNQQSGGDMAVHIPPGTLPDIPDTNPFHALSSFAQIAAPSVQAAMVVGSSIALIGESMNREIPRERRYEMAGKAGISLFTFGLGLLDALDSIEQKKNKQQTEDISNGSE